MNELAAKSASAPARLPCSPPAPYGSSVALLPSWQVSASRAAALLELERRVFSALSTYANVHRGSGYRSAVTTALYDHARLVVLDHLGLKAKRYVVIFASPAGAQHLVSMVGQRDVHVSSSEALGLPLGVRALAVRRRALPRGKPTRMGGGTARLVSPKSAIWEDAPERFEPGTPAIINVIAFACALQITQRCGADVFRSTHEQGPTRPRPVRHDDLAALTGGDLLHALRRSIVGRDTQVPVEDGTTTEVYLDHAASTPTFGPVWSAVCQAMRLPAAARAELAKDVRRICAAFVGASQDEYAVVFTANTTEAINAVASTIDATAGAGVHPVVLNTWLEHNSNELPWRTVRNGSLLRLSVDDEGFIDPDELERILREYNLDAAHGARRITLVAVSGASNVLGTQNDLTTLCRIAHRYGATVLVDAAQLAGHRKIEMERWGIDYLALSGHKLYAPFGTGALIARRDLLEATRATWEALNESGQENTAGIAALGTALSLLQRVGMDCVEAEERRLTGRLLEGISELPDVKVWGVSDPKSLRAPLRGGIVTFNIKHVPHNRLARELAERGGIGIRTGCHCAHLLVKRLFGVHPLQAKIPDLIALLFPNFARTALPGLARVSLGLGNDDGDIDHFLATLRAICEAPRSRMDRSVAASQGGAPFLPDSAVTARVNVAIEAAVRSVFG